MRPRLRQVGDVCGDSGYKPSNLVVLLQGGRAVKMGGTGRVRIRRAIVVVACASIPAALHAESVMGQNVGPLAVPGVQVPPLPEVGCPQCPRRRPCRPFHRCRAFPTSPNVPNVPAPPPIPSVEVPPVLRPPAGGGPVQAPGVPSAPVTPPDLPGGLAGSGAPGGAPGGAPSSGAGAGTAAGGGGGGGQAGAAAQAPGRVPAARGPLAPGSGRTGRCAGGRCAASATGSRRPRPTAASHCCPRAGGASYGFAQGSAPAARLPRA